MSDVGPRLHVLVERAGQTVYRGTHTAFPVIIGRSPESTIQLPYGFVSRTHGSLSVENGLLVVKDLGSRHKFESGRGQVSELRIEGRGHFRIGDLEILVRLEQPLSEDPEKTLASTAPTRTFQRPARAVPPDEVRKEDRRQAQRRSPTPGAAAAQIRANSFTVPSSPAVSTSAEGLQVVHEDPRRAPEKKSDLWPLFEGAMGTFEWTLDPNVASIQSSADVAVQGAVSWGPHLFDVRNFIVGDRLRISPNLNDEISLPTLTKAVKVGQFEARGAFFKLPKDLSWSLRRNGVLIDEGTLRQESRLKETKNGSQLMLQKEEILTLNFTPELKSHFRYIKKPMPFFPRTWIENKEHFKKAIQASLLVHLILSAVALLSVPEVKAPEVENVPKRFAKLLVEPPKQILPEPPPPPPEPPPPPPPIVAEKPPPKPPRKPKEKLKPVKAAEKTPPKPQPVAAPPPKPAPAVAKIAMPAPGPAAKGAPPPTKKPPAPSPAEVEAAALQSLFNSMPNPGATTAKLPGNVKLVKTGGVAAPGVKVGGLVSQVPKAGGATASGLGKTPSALAEAGQAGYAATAGGKAGTRRIGGVVADAAKMAGSPQGLSMSELMAVVNRYLADIQRCYERALVENPNLVGRVEYEWEINPQGAVNSASVKRSELSGADGLNQCVLKIIRSMPFPRSKNGLPTVTSVGFPFGRQ